MKILAQSTDGVDILVGAILGECPNAAARKLEELDAKLFCELANETWSGKRRFVTVKRDWRTILTLAGAVTFRRRYYLDRSTGRYTHPLDAAMGLCRYSRASADVRLKILDMAGECPYRYVGANAVPGQVLSKSTVCRIIRDTAVTSARGKMDPGKSAVHVQIDEKYISMIGKKHKSRYITATIYAGKKTASGRNALTNRTLISGVEVADVAAKINAALSEAYGLNADSSVYLSGDLAGYIQSFPERLMCKATYVPDKWHVCRFLSSKGSPVKAEDVLKKLESIDETGDMTGLSEDAAKVYRLWKGNPKIFDPWAKDDYLGCCQEAMNSHYYAPRFGKYANRFKKVTVAMLSMVREARENGWELKISSKSLREEGTSLLATLGRPYEDVMKYDIDTREMDYATRKMFARIEYPDICLSGLR